MKKLIGVLAVMLIFVSVYATHVSHSNEGTTANGANIINEGRFFMDGDIIYGPFGDKLNLAAYFPSHEVKEISNENAFNLIVHNNIIYYLNQPGCLIKIHDGVRTILNSEGISHFFIYENMIYCLNYSDPSQFVVTELSLNGKLRKTIFAYDKSDPRGTPIGTFSIGAGQIYFPIGKTGMLMIDIKSGQITDISSYIMSIEQIGMIRDVVYQNGKLYFLGQIFYGNYERPSYLFELDVSQKSIQKITHDETTQYTMDDNYIYYYAPSKDEIIKLDLNTNISRVLTRDISPTAFEIVGNRLYYNEGGVVGATCLYDFINVEKTAD